MSCLIYFFGIDRHQVHGQEFNVELFLACETCFFIKTIFLICLVFPYLDEFFLHFVEFFLKLGWAENFWFRPEPSQKSLEPEPQANKIFWNFWTATFGHWWGQKLDWWQIVKKIWLKTSVRKRSFKGFETEWENGERRR